MALVDLSATEQLAKLKSREVTAVELAQAYLDRIASAGRRDRRLSACDG